MGWPRRAGQDVSTARSGKKKLLSNQWGRFDVCKEREAGNGLARSGARTSRGRARARRRPRPQANQQEPSRALGNERAPASNVAGQEM